MMTKISEVEDVIKGLRTKNIIERLCDCRTEIYGVESNDECQPPFQSRSNGNTSDTAHVELLEDSMIKHIKPEYLLPKSERKVSSVYTWEEAKIRLDSPVNLQITVIFHLGTNDILRKCTEESVQ